MSLGLRPQPPEEKEAFLPLSGEYEIPNPMTQGFCNAKTYSGAATHPLEYSERNWRLHGDAMDYEMLKYRSGLHMPLRLEMERKITSRMHKLAGLHSSNLMADTLSGSDDFISFDDIFNNGEDREYNINIHMAMEKQKPQML